MRAIILLIFLFPVAGIFSQVSNTGLKITHVTDNFYVFTTYKPINGNPFPANGLYLITDSGAVMFDTPWDTTQFQPLLDSIQLKHHENVILCIATHFHEDRTGGLEYYKQHGIKTYTTKKTDELSKERGMKRADYLIDHDTSFTVGKYTFQTYYPGQGHTPDNIVIWFDKEKILYGGCMIKSSEAADLGYLGDANVKDWNASMKNIQNKFKQPKFIITGHQDWNSKRPIVHTLKLIQQHKKKS